MACISEVHINSCKVTRLVFAYLTSNNYQGSMIFNCKQPNLDFTVSVRDSARVGSVLYRMEKWGISWKEC